MENGKAYTYLRYMRDGSTQVMHAVTRSRSKRKDSGGSQGAKVASRKVAAAANE